MKNMDVNKIIVSFCPYFTPCIKYVRYDYILAKFDYLPWPGKKSSILESSLYWFQNPNSQDPGCLFRLRLAGQEVRITWSSVTHCRHQFKMHKIHLMNYFPLKYTKNSFQLASNNAVFKQTCQHTGQFSTCRLCVHFLKADLTSFSLLWKSLLIKN